MPRLDAYTKPCRCWNRPWYRVPLSAWAIGRPCAWCCLGRGISALAVRKTLSRYTLQGDRGDIDAFLGAFTEDAVLEFVGEWRAQGHAGIRERTATVTDQTRNRRGPLLRHHLGTHGVEFESDACARAWTYFTAYTEIGPDHAGRYVDRLRCESARRCAGCVPRVPCGP